VSILEQVVHLTVIALIGLGLWSVALVIILIDMSPPAFIVRWPLLASALLLALAFVPWLIVVNITSDELRHRSYSEDDLKRLERDGF